MTSLRRTLLPLLLTLLSFPSLSAPPYTSDILALSGGRVIDGYGGKPLENAVVVIKGNRITEIGAVGSVAIPQGARTIDVGGMTLLPGLWDSHGHLMHVGEGDPNEFPTKFASRMKEVMEAAARITLLSGVTSFRDAGGPLDEQLELRKAIEARQVIGPRLFLAGPILWQVTAAERRQKNASSTSDAVYVTTAKQARRETQALISRGVDMIKVYGFWDVDILREVSETAHASGIGVDADVRHVSAYRTAIEAGVDRLHHVFTADPLSDYSDDELRLLLRAERPSAYGPVANILRGPYIVPTMEMRKAYVRFLDHPSMLSHPRFKQQYPVDIYEHLRSSWADAASIPWGIGAPQRIERATEKLRRFILAGGREQIVAGTDAGAPLNVHSPLIRELRNLHEAGLSAMEVIQSATLRAAQMQGVADHLGTLSRGKLADILVVDGDPLSDLSVLEHRIVLVIKDGVVHPRTSASIVKPATPQTTETDAQRF